MGAALILEVHVGTRVNHRRDAPNVARQRRLQQRCAPPCPRLADRQRRRRAERQRAEEPWLVGHVGAGTAGLRRAIAGALAVVQQRPALIRGTLALRRRQVRINERPGGRRLGERPPARRACQRLVPALHEMRPQAAFADLAPACGAPVDLVDHGYGSVAAAVHAHGVVG